MPEVRRWSWSGLETPGDRLSGTVPGVISKNKENFILTLKLHILSKVHSSTWKAGLLEESVRESRPRSLSLVKQYICYFEYGSQSDRCSLLLNSKKRLCLYADVLHVWFLFSYSFSHSVFQVMQSSLTWPPKSGNYTPGTPETLRCQRAIGTS